MQARSSRLERAVALGALLERSLARSLDSRASPAVGTLAALGLGLLLLLVAPALSGHLWTRNGVLGSLDDRHAQVLILVVAPVLWAGYLWQPSAISRVWATLAPPEAGPARRGTEGTTHAQLPIAAAASAAAAIIFDLNQVLPRTGFWWGSASALTVALREVLLGVSVFVMVSLLVRHVRAISSWSSVARGDRPLEPGPVTAALTEYGLGSAALVAVVGIRLVMEAVELPTREGRITPDYYLKTAIYVAAAFVLVIAPLSRILMRPSGPSASRLRFSLVLASIVLAPPVVGLILALATP